MMKEADIRPAELIARYLELCEEDARNFPDKDLSLQLACIACGSSKYKPAFNKSDFFYSKCCHCGTVYLNPRPPLSSFEYFYKNSLSSSYWSDVFLPAVAEVRRQAIFKPRVHDVISYFKNREHSINSLIDVGAGFGLFLEEWRRVSPLTSLYAIEPSPSLAKSCREKGFDVYEDVVEKLELNSIQKVDLVVCFEVLEHVHDPLNFIKCLKRFLKPKGRLLITTLSYSGFDLQILKSRSSQVSPPHHINFFTLKGFHHLFQAAGFTHIEVTTPGKLDVDIVSNYVNANSDVDFIPSFVHGILSSDDMRSTFQDFLVSNNLSSHAWVCCHA